MTKEDYKGLLARKILVDLLPNKLYDIKISKESDENIKEAKNLLDENSKLNLIAYFNHITFEDPWYVGYILNKIDPEANRHLVAPISYSHTRSSASKAILLPAKLCGMETIRIIQANEVEHYKKSEVLANYRNFMKRLEELGKNPKPTAFIISPEGHRSENGELGAANTGMITVAKKLGETLIISVGIAFNEDFYRSKPNIGKSLELTISKPYLHKKDDNIDFYMTRLAETLPENMRGRWTQMPEVRK